MLAKRLWSDVGSSGARPSRYICPNCQVSLTKRRNVSRRSHQSQLDLSASPPDTGTLRKITPHKKFAQTKNPSPRIFTHLTPNTVFSLIQPTGIPHLGNYLGALRPWLRLQQSTTGKTSQQSGIKQIIIGLADLHSLSNLKQSPTTRRRNIRETYAALLAIGLNPKTCTIFVQSQVPEHSELMWILSNIASTGYLGRMTQWKDKIGLSTTSSTSSTAPEISSDDISNLDEKSREALKLSLLSYPVLQAADILLYGTNSVPVGADQAQHIEFTRQLARSFNTLFPWMGTSHDHQDFKPGEKQFPLFNVPEIRLPRNGTSRIMSLQDPTKKMSKSDPNEMSRVLITDDADTIVKKIRAAKTDSIQGPITYDPIERPGVSNLIDIYRAVTGGDRPPELLAADFAERDLGLGGLKKEVGQAVSAELEGVKPRFEQLVMDSDGSGELESAMKQGLLIARAKAAKMMKKIKQSVGLDTMSADEYRRVLEDERRSGMEKS